MPSFGPFSDDTVSSSPTFFSSTLAVTNAVLRETLSIGTGIATVSAVLRETLSTGTGVAILSTVVREILTSPIMTAFTRSARRNRQYLIR